jgi:hypothetical protein
MSTNGLRLAALALCTATIASGCPGGGTRSGSVSDVRHDFNRVGGGQGFGVPGHDANSPTESSSGVDFSPGFGAPPYSAPTGAAGGASIGFAPGFGSPPGSGAAPGQVPPTTGGPRPGGGSSGGGGQLLSDLTEAQAEQLCEEFEQEIERSFGSDGFARLSCTFTALVESLTVDGNGQQTVNIAACEAAFAACVADSSDSTSVDCDASELLSDAATCDASVAQFESCIRASFAQAAQLIDTFNCRSLTTPQAVQQALAGGGTGNVTECIALQSACPGLVGTGGVVDGGGSGGSGGIDGGGTGGSEPEPPPGGCDDTCFFAGDDECDDGGPDSITSECELGTDCMDCGPR